MASPYVFSIEMKNCSGRLATMQAFARAYCVNNFREKKLLIPLI